MLAVRFPTRPAQYSVECTPTVLSHSAASTVWRRTRTLQAPCAHCWLPRRRQLSCSVCQPPTVPSHVAASTVCAAHTDTSGSMCSLSAASTPPAQLFGRLDTDRALTRHCIDGVCSAHGHCRLRVLAVGTTPSAQYSVGWTPTVPSHAAASTVCAAHTDTSGSVSSLSASPTPIAQVFGRLDVDRAVTCRCIDGVCGAHRHFRLRVIAVGFIDAVSSSFGRLDTDCAVTRRYRRCVRRTRTLQAPCARFRLPRRRQLSV